VTAEGEGMAQMQVSQGDCVSGIGHVTPCPPDPEKDLEISEDVRRFLTSPADLDSRSLMPPRIPLAKCGDGITNISALLGRFSRSFHHMKGISVIFLDPPCHGNRFWAKFAK